MLQELIHVEDIETFQSQIQVVFDSLDEGIFIVDEQGKILILNQTASDLTGYSISEILGKPVEAVILGHPKITTSGIHHPNFSDHPHGMDGEHSQIRREAKFPAQIMTKHGQKVAVEITHIHFPDQKNKLSFVIVKNISNVIISDTLREINSKLSASLNLVEVYDLLLVELQKLIPYDAGNVMLVENDRVRVTRTLGYEHFGSDLLEKVLSLQFEIDSTDNIRRIVHNRQIVTIPDVQTSPGWIATEVSSHFHSWIGVPIVIDDQVDAIISLDKVETNFFNEEHESILSIFSHQAASAIKNARLFEAESRRIQQLDGLQSTLTAINSQLDLNTLLKEIVDKAIKLLNASTGELALYDPEINKLRIVVCLNQTKDFTGALLEVGKGVLGTVAATKKPYKVDRFTDEAKILENLRFLGSHSGMAVPLMAGKELLGVLGIADQKSNQIFDQEDVDLLCSFAQQATIAINNSRLYEDARRRAEEAETLRKVGAVVTSSLDQSQAVNLILEQVAEVIPCDSAMVLLQKKDYLKIVGGLHLPNMDQLLTQRLMLSDKTPLSKVFLEKKPVMIKDIFEDLPNDALRPKLTTGIRSWLGAPLIIQDHAIGLLALHSDQARHFTSDHMRLASAFADQVAIALENARLYTSTAHSATRFETLYHLSQIISTNLRSEDIYPAIHEAVSELMVTDFFCISLFNAKKHMIEDVYMVDKGKHMPLTCRSLDHGLTSTVIRNGKSLLFHTFDSITAKESGSVKLSQLDETRIPQSIIMVPMKIGSNCVGVISAQSYQPHMYSGADREILELLAANVAIAVENARLFDEVQELAITDPLTKLYNRRKFEDLALNEFKRSRRYHRSMCIIMIDLDNFKEVNDTHGHIVGDQVLVGLASLCRNNLREVDILARVGGEEFIILLPEATAEKALHIAERLRQDCEQTDFSTNQGNISITISLGLVELDAGIHDLEEMVDRADQALYASKRNGRNITTLWSPEITKDIPPEGYH